ncbi:mechanosensitive ion channel family protein [Streptomyces boninensis]|uniref:mechanosensitive ion channel family protein n=1 Tax=Streptomyces boninensis TaxID=2039455 RepID=UPI003B20E47F
MPIQLALSVDFGQGFTDAMSSVISFIPKLIGFLVIMVIGWIIAKVIARACTALMHRLNFHHLVERSGISRHMERTNMDAVGLVSKIIYYAILLMTLQMALGVFGPNPVSDLLRSIVAWLPKAIVAVLLVVITMAIAKRVREIVEGALSGTSYGRTVATVAWAFIVSLGVIAALGQAGIATSITGPLLTAVLATAAGIAIVGVGGGLIAPMRQRWERWLAHVEQEQAKVSTGNGSGPSAYQAGRSDAAAGQPAGEYETGSTRPLGDEGYGRR